MSSVHNYALFSYFDERRASFGLRAFPNQSPPRYERPPIQSAYALSLNNTPDVGDTSALADVVFTARARFDEAVDLVDYFFKSEQGADGWKICEALNRAHPALVSLFGYLLFLALADLVGFLVVGFIRRQLRSRSTPSV